MEAFLSGRNRSKAGSSTEKASGDKSSSNKQEKRKIPWVEKYRPRCVGEVSHQDEVVSVLKKCVEGVDLPNLLFYGPPGTGKTSAILALAREMFDADIYKSRVLELNASDERGIQVIREKVKTFAQISASSVKANLSSVRVNSVTENGMKKSYSWVAVEPAVNTFNSIHSTADGLWQHQPFLSSHFHSGKPCPPFKIVILDEADSMTGSAQAALRRTMEKESKTTRFCLICNYISRIIEPLTSRCSKFRFKPLSVDTLTKRLEYIREQEKVNCSNEVLQVIVEVCEGDLRKAITLLQSAHRLRSEEDITQDDILEIAGIVPPKFLESFMEACHSNSYDRLENAVQDVIAEGFSASQTVSQLHDLVVDQVELNDKQKSIICERIGLVDKRLSDGADEYLQLMDLAGVIMTQFCQA